MSRRARCVGLVGENGAGKSTLDEDPRRRGAARAGGIDRRSTASPRSPDGRRLDARGIAFVHQELNLFENLTVAANIFIGREPLRGGPLKLIDERRLSATGQRPLLQQLGADFGPDTPVGALSLARDAARRDRQGAVAQGPAGHHGRADLQPDRDRDRTAARQSSARLKADGVSIIFISHRLTEVERMRRPRRRAARRQAGRRAAERARSTRRPMIRHMIGRDLKTLYRQPARTSRAPPSLELVDVRTAYRPAQTVDLAVRRGEILGLAGLVGSGRTELARTIFGLDPLVGGEIRIDGERCRIGSPRDAIERGIFLVPEDRKRSGLILDFPIRDNITLANLPALCARSGWSIADAEDSAGAETQRSSLGHPLPRRRRRASARCPAATSRRWCWRNGCRCSRGC